MARVARKISVNVATVLALQMLEAVPLWPGDPSALPHAEQLAIAATALLSKGNVPATLHPFMLSVVPFMQGSLMALSLWPFSQHFAGPLQPFRMSAEMRQTAYGQKASQALSRIFGAISAFLAALWLAWRMAAVHMCTRREVLGLALAMTAGSCICLWLADAIDRHGVGSGLGFLYTVAIATGAPNAYQGLPVPQRVRAHTLARVQPEHSAGRS